MIGRVVRASLFGLALVLVLWGTLRIVFPTDAQRIARVIERARKGIVREDLSLVLSVVDRSYEDEFGMDYDRLRRWLQSQFRTYDSITCVIPRLRIDVCRPEANCTLNFWLAGYTRGRRFPQASEALTEVYPFYADQLTLYLYKYETGWRIVGASP